MTMTIEERIAELQKKKDEIHVQIEALKSLSVAFPDLKVNINRWNTVRYESDCARPMCNEIEIAHNCGCCNDSPIELWPYYESNGNKIYAGGIPFQIGERYYHRGEKPYEGWQERLRAKGINEEVIAKVQHWFDENPWRPFSEEDDD